MWCFSFSVLWMASVGRALMHFLGFCFVFFLLFTPPPLFLDKYIQFKNDLTADSIRLAKLIACSTKKNCLRDLAMLVDKQFWFARMCILDRMSNSPLSPITRRSCVQTLQRHLGQQFERRAAVVACDVDWPGHKRRDSVAKQS